MGRSPRRRASPDSEGASSGRSAREVPRRLGLVEHGLDPQAPQATRHDPFDLVPDAIAEHRGSDRREHRDLPLGEVRVLGVDQRVLEGCTLIEIEEPGPGIHRDDIRRDLGGRYHARTLDLDDQLAHVVAIPGRGRSLEERHQALAVLGGQEDAALAQFESLLGGRSPTRLILLPRKSEEAPSGCSMPRYGRNPASRGVAMPSAPGDGPLHRRRREVPATLGRSARGP